MGKGRFRAFDAFQKTVEEARIKTASGGLVTLVSACIIFWLVILEVWDWRRVVIRNELIVDKTRGTAFFPLVHLNVASAMLIIGDRLDIRMNITFPYIPCGSLFFFMEMADEQCFRLM